MSLTSKDKISIKKEEEYYEPIRKALVGVFIRYLQSKGDFYLEDTSKGKFSDKLKRALDDSALHIIRVEQFSPDLTGFLQKDRSVEIITVEVKRQIKVRHIYKAKLYSEILNAKYGLLISPKPIPEDIRRFIKHRWAVTSSQYPTGNILILQFNEKENQFVIDNELYPSPPEPFKSFLKANLSQKPECFGKLKKLPKDSPFPNICLYCTYMYACAGIKS